MPTKGDGHENQDDQRNVAVLGLHQRTLGGKGRDLDRGENQQRHAVADAALGDELTHPHQQGGAGGEGEDHDEDGPGVELRQEVDRADQATAVEQERKRGRLHHGDRDRQVAGPLGDLALTDRSLLLPLLDLGNHHAKDLHDDRCRDVRHDAEREHRELGERTAREELNEAQDAALVGLVAKQLDRFDIDPRGRDERAKSIDRNDHQREQDLAAQIGDPEHVQNSLQHGALLSGPVSRADRNGHHVVPPRIIGWCAGCSCRATANPERLRQDFNRAAGAGDRFLRRLREGVGLHGDGRTELTTAEDLDGRALGHKTTSKQAFRGDLGEARLGDRVQVDRLVLDTKRVGEAAQLRHPLDQGHLTALETHRNRVAAR